MRRAATAAALIAAVLAAAPALGQARPRTTTPVKPPPRLGLALAPGDPAPEFAASDLGGRRLDVVYEGHAATLVAFFRSGCVPCGVEMPTLQKLHAAHAAGGLQVVGVAIDAGDAMRVVPAVRAFLAESGADYTVVRSTLEIERKWRGITVLPTVFLVDRSGKLVRRYAGADEAILAGLVADVDAWLAGRPLAEQVLPGRTGDVTVPR